MKVTQHVLYAIDDAEAGKFDSALMHACFSIDATAKRLPNAPKLVGDRYKACLRQYYWLLEPMVGAGFNLVDSRFANVQLKKNISPDFADLIYEIFRCSHAHGDEVPSAYSVLPTSGPFGSTWGLGKGEIHMPDRVIWALLSVPVFSRVNSGEKTTGDYYLSLGEERFAIRDWWGREDDLRPVAERYNQVRVTLAGLDRLEDPQPGVAQKVEHVVVVNPPFLETAKSAS